MQSSKIRSLVKQNDALLTFVASLFLYGISAGIKINKQTEFPQYVYLAYSFLHGRLDLLKFPPNQFDLIFFHNKWFVPGGMAPALLLMPVVALFGLNTSDILFGVIIGSANVAIMYWLLKELTETIAPRIWLTILFAVGTVHWWLSSIGSVWFNAHLVAFLFMGLFIRAALRNNSWQAGLWLGLAALSRPPVLFSAAFYPAYLLSRGGDLKSVFKRTLPFGFALTGIVSIMLASDYLTQLSFG